MQDGLQVAAFAELAVGSTSAACAHRRMSSSAAMWTDGADRPAVREHVQRHCAPMGRERCLGPPSFCLWKVTVSVGHAFPACLSRMFCSEDFGVRVSSHSPPRRRVRGWKRSISFENEIFNVPHEFPRLRSVLPSKQWGRARGCTCRQCEVRSGATASEFGLQSSTGRCGCG